MLLSKATNNKYICQKKEKQYISVGTVKMFIETVFHRNCKCQAFTIARLTLSLYTTKIARIRC